MQRINIGVCSVNSYDKKKLFLQNHYGIDLGTDGLVIQAQSREEIFADKLLAFALRPNRLKYRDLWDMIWLHQRGIQPHLHLIPLKLQDRGITPLHFKDAFEMRFKQLLEEKHLASEFAKEMSRFLPPKKDINLGQLWPSIILVIKELQKNMEEEMA